MSHPVIAIIGAGNMGSSLISGLISAGHPREALWATDPSKEKLEEIKKKFGIHVATENTQAVEKANVVILAVKPQMFHTLLAELKNSLQTIKPLIISIAAGIQITGMQQDIGDQLAIVRAMPNTPALIGCGATALYANQHVTHDQRNLAETILRAVGIVVWVASEHLMDTVTALSGSGPAYFFLVMEALQQAAEQLGLPAETARLLTLETALGASRMAIESGHTLKDLRRQVTSPGGTTEKAVSILEENNLRGLFQKALSGAKLRSEELAALLSS